MALSIEIAMVIIKKASGQLANKLHFLSNFIANSIEHDYLLIITCFPEYHNLFAPATENKLNIIISKQGILNKVVNKVLNKLQAISLKYKFNFPRIIFHCIPENDYKLIDYNINKEEFTEIAQTKIVLPEGWVYRDKENLKKQQNTIKSFFSLQDIFKKQVSQHIEVARKAGDIIIGVHIRRGDYIDFNEGKWFYDNDTYIKKMGEVAQLFPGKQCVFIICANEEIDRSDFKDFTTLIHQRPAIVDLYLLSECDYVFGPPSTFTGWASFYNNVPAYYIDEPETKITMNSFNKWFG